MIAAYQDVCPEGGQAWRPLPTEEGRIPVRLGVLPKGARLALLVGFDRVPECPRLTVNDVPVTDLTLCDRGAVDADRPNRFCRRFADHCVLMRAELPNDGNPVQTVGIHGTRVVYLEIEAF